MICPVCGGLPPGDASGAIDICTCNSIERVFDVGAKRHKTKWYTANLAAVHAARSAGLSPERNAEAIALIVLRVLDAVDDRPLRERLA